MSNTTDALQTGQKAVTQNFDRAMSGLKDGVSEATAGLEQAQTSMKQGMEKAMKVAQDLMSFNQGNIEALTQSSQIFATGIQDIIQHITNSSKASMEDAMSTMKTVSAVKSVREAMDLQSSLVRSTLERAVTQASQLTDSTMKLSQRTLAPVTARLTLATATFGRTS